MCLLLLLLFYFCTYLVGRRDICKNFDRCDLTLVRSIRYIQGSCGQIVDGKDGSSSLLFKDAPNVTYKKGTILTSCPRTSSHMYCPPNTFVKQIQWNKKTNMTSGFIVNCATVDSTFLEEPNITSSYPLDTSSYDTKRTCAGFDRVTIEKDEMMDVVTNFLIRADCSREPEKTSLSSEAISCPFSTGLSGFVWSTEAHSKLLMIIIQLK